METKTSEEDEGIDEELLVERDLVYYSSIRGRSNRRNNMLLLVFSKKWREKSMRFSAILISPCRTLAFPLMILSILTKTQMECNYLKTGIFSIFQLLYRDSVLSINNNILFHRDRLAI